MLVMDYSFFLTVVAAAIGFFTLFGTPVFMVYRKIKFHQEKKDLLSYSPSSLSSLSSSSLTSSPWTHDVFPSFRGEDIRINFLSHIKKEFRRKGITPFIDNNITRGEFIGPELVLAIKRSKIAIVIISKNYASSKWCLDELVEIMKCKEFGQMVFAIFYDVDPSDVKKLTGEFGAIFKKTCAGKTKEDIGRWRQAFAEVATIAGYDSRNWDDEAVMIEVIVNEISKRLINSSPSRSFEGLVGMGAHIDEMQSLLCLDSDEVRMIGILGPPGIGKTTIARVTHNQYSGGFELNVFMDMKSSYTRPTCSDDYKVKLHLEKLLLSQLTDQEVFEIPHLGVAQNFLMNKKVLVVLDGVDQLVQLRAMPEARFLGPGTRIIITTQNQKLLNAIGIKHIYNVSYPPDAEALQIFCINAFGQNTPYDGFESLAWEVTTRAGKLPLGLRVMGSHLQGMSKEKWTAELPRLRVRLDGEIGSILKLSYDSLEGDEKDLFLHIACFFNRGGTVHNLGDILGHKFSKQVFCVLRERSLISDQQENLMHELLAQLGREIVRNQSNDEPGKRWFLDDAKEICEVLTHSTGSRSIIGIDLKMGMMASDQYISERAFEVMYNLELLRFSASSIIPTARLRFPRLVNYLPPNLRLLHWKFYPSTCLPSSFDTQFLVSLEISDSKLEKLWEGIQPLGNLKRMILDHSYYLKEIPDLLNATNLEKLSLVWCSRLVELPFSIGNATSLQKLNLHGCSSLVELPFSIRNLTNLQKMNLHGCSSLVELPFSIRKATNLQNLNLQRCSSLVEIPSSIGSLINLKKLDLRWCSSLAKLPDSIGNLINLKKLKLTSCSNLVEIPSSIGKLINLQKLKLNECSSLVEFPSSIGNLINLKELNLCECSSMEVLPSSIGNFINLEDLNLYGCSSLDELPSSIGNLINLKALNLCWCTSLVELPCSIGNLINLHKLHLSNCSHLVEIPSSIGNLHMLPKLMLQGCLMLEVLPTNINLDSLTELDVTGCSQLATFPEITTGIERLLLCGTLINEIPLSIKSWSQLRDLHVTYFKDLEEFPHALDMITELEFNNKDIEKVPSWVGGMSRLRRLVINKCPKLASLPKFLSSLSSLYVESCESLERLACSFPNPNVCLRFINCWKLNEKARIIICKTSTSDYAILPGREVPLFFPYRATTTGGFLRVKLNKRYFPTNLRFKACIMLVNNGTDDEAESDIYISCTIGDMQSRSLYPKRLKEYFLDPVLAEHLYTFEYQVDNVKSRELLFKFKINSDIWEISECGICQLFEEENLVVVADKI